MDWQEEYKGKLVSAEEAVKIVESGDRVAIPILYKPQLLQAALFARRDELKGVEILRLGHGSDPGWLQPGYEDSFKVILGLYVGDTARPSLDERRSDFWPSIFSLEFKAVDERPSEERKDIDVLLTIVSQPNKDGFCSFGADLWHKRSYAKRARKIIAEVDSNQIRTYGENYIHISEIDRFVENTPQMMSDEDVKKILASIDDEERREKLAEVIGILEPERRHEFVPMLLGVKTKDLDFAPRAFGLAEPDEPTKQIAEYVKTLIKDGDTIQLGTGAPSGLLPRLGVFDNKIDLGIHTEMAARGMGTLVREGVATGKRKNLHPGKAVFSTLTGMSVEEIKYAAENPLFELYDTEYVTHIRTVAAHDNYVAINSAISIDFTGQINAETVFGGRVWNGALGQVDQHIGAVLSKGGRAITLLYSTAVSGAVSRIVHQHEEGTVVSIPRYFADYVVSEYGIARLLGKTCRQRAEELIAIAHPDFRGELRKAAQKLFYP